MSKGKSGKDQGQNHGRNLGPDHDPLAIEAVGHDAAHRGHQEYRNLAGETRRPQQAAQIRSGDRPAMTLQYFASTCRLGR